MRMPASTIAIDGPAASGKSTLAQRLASRLGYLLFDTGVMYRAVTLAAIRRGLDLNSEEDLGGLAETASLDVRPPSVPDGRGCDVLLDGEDVTGEIRSSPVDQAVSQVSSYARVRQAMTLRQREIGARGRVVMVGRDIGTIVMPDADLKIYLDASPEVRAWRRVRQGEGRETYGATLEAIRRRDDMDSSRAVAPLRPAQDAQILNTSELTIEDVLDWALRLARTDP
ncbi:MAG: (d)CMP kinase [Anaerolineales bacterium]